MLNNKGSNRAVIDSIIAHTSEIYWLQKDKSKYTVWIPSHPHNVGELCEWTDMESLALLQKQYKGKSSNMSMSTLNKYPLQQIFYGAPGTGKSYKTNEVAKKYSTIRTTFHPDSDYSTFVGAYKPTTTEEDRYGLNGSNTVALKYPDGAEKGKCIKEKKIEYRFVKQAFLKAYIKAWKFFIQPPHNGSTPDSQIELVSLTSDKDSWLLESMDNQYVYYTKKSIIAVKEYEQLVKKCWDSIVSSENPDEYDLGSTERYQATVCFWYKDNHSIDATADDCWNEVYNELNSGNQIVFCPGSNQYYTATLENDSIVITSKSKAYRTTIEKVFNDTKRKMSGSVQMSIANKLKEYKVGFEEAWNQLKEEIGNNQNSGFGLLDSNAITPQFLVIEEINRGNCAQIFGDLFQLLDRKNGFSEYPIEADEDIRKSLLNEDTETDPSFGENGLQFSDSQKDAINAVFNNKEEDAPFRNVADDIASGKLLVLPPNLYIWATMNTSDQSLFPIDSAFKRRWNWKYVRICEGKKKDGTPLDYRIKFAIPAKGEEPEELVDEKWWEFVKAINTKIEEATKSEDKKLGFFFCKPDKKANEADECNTIISAETFVGKVVFYLWQDVFKDYGFKSDIFKNGDKKISFHDFYPEDMVADETTNPEGIDLALVKTFIYKVLGKKEDKTSETTSEA